MLDRFSDVDFAIFEFFAGVRCRLELRSAPENRK